MPLRGALVAGDRCRRDLLALGWWPFGYRFSLDFMVPVVTLLSLGAEQGVGRPMRLLILLGVLVNAWGVWWFLNPKFF